MQLFFSLFVKQTFKPLKMAGTFRAYPLDAHTHYI